MERASRPRQSRITKQSVVRLAAFAVVSVGESVWVFGWRASHVCVSGGEHRTIIENAKTKKRKSTRR